jgi:hypothetical protein
MIVPSAHIGTASAVIIDRPRRYSEEFRYARQSGGNAYRLARLTVTGLVRLSYFVEIASVLGERWALAHRFFRGY